MHKRSLLLATAMLALLLGGCDDGEPTPSNPGGTSNPTSQTFNTTTTNIVGGSSSSDTQVNPSQTTSSSAPGTSSQTTSGNITSANTGSSSVSTTHITTGQITSSHSGTHTGTGGGGPVTSSTSITQISSVAPISFTITFDSNGGSAVSSIQAAAGTQVNKPADPTLNGYKFTGWSLNQDGSGKVSWPYTLGGNVTMYANWTEKVNIKGYFTSALQALGQKPSSYLPESLLPQNVAHYHVAQLTYDFSSYTSVSNIAYGGFGEQWQMVISNIEQSNTFFKVLTLGETAMSASIVALNSFLDENTADTASTDVNESSYYAKLTFDGTILSYSLKLKTSINLPLIGEVTPQIDVDYNILLNEKTVRIGINEANALKYIQSENTYAFGIKYGVEAVSRTAYFSIVKDEYNNIEGHIFEYVQYKDKDLIPAYADFYIGETYTTVVGNKASGLTGFTNYICELYKTNEGKLLGYEIQETFSSMVYNTLWFNLDNITGINSYAVIDDKVHVNNSESVFTTKKFGGLSSKTLSRRYDIEQRTQYFYDLVGEEKTLTEYQTSVPMMFVQEEKLSDFVNDVHAENNYLNVSINLSETYLNQIMADYDMYVPILIEHHDNVTGSDISTFIGSAKDLS